MIDNSNITTYLDLLHAIPLFSGLSAQQLNNFALAAAESSFKRGRIIFQFGEPADKLFIIATGKVKVYRSGPDGREVILHLFGPGESLAEAALFQQGLFPASAEALEDTRLLYWPRNTILRLLADDPNLALNMLGALSLRLKEFAAKIETLALHETPQRLAAYLLHQSGLNNGADSFELDISKGLLAAVLGTARETLSRCLGRLVKEEVLALEGRSVRILNRDFLEDLARGLADRV